MKNRDYKQFAAGTIQHIYNRGVGKMDIFQAESDFVNFIKRLNLALGSTRMVQVSQGSSLLRIIPLPKEAFTILCYCLMPNHFHFIIRQNTDIPIGKLISKISTSYSMYFNKKYNHVGGIFQDQYKAIVIDSDSYLLWLSGYIHNNPKTAGIVSDLKDYPWSSYLDYTGKRKGILCNQSLILGMMANNRARYTKFVDESYLTIQKRKDIEHLLLD